MCCSLEPLHGPSEGRAPWCTIYFDFPNFLPFYPNVIFIILPFSVNGLLRWIVLSHWLAEKMWLYTVSIHSYLCIHIQTCAICYRSFSSLTELPRMRFICNLPVAIVQFTCEVLTKLINIFWSLFLHSSTHFHLSRWQLLCRWGFWFEVNISSRMRLTRSCS